jgi:hypothetical protein
MKTNSKQVQKRQRLIAALLQTSTVEKAAEAAGMSAVTGWRIRRTAEFRVEFNEACQQAFGQSEARAQFASNMALSVMLRIMTDPNEKASSRVRAAVEVVNHAKQATERDQLRARAVIAGGDKRVTLSRLSSEQLAQARQLALAAQQPDATP